MTYLIMSPPLQILSDLPHRYLWKSLPMTPVFRELVMSPVSGVTYLLYLELLEFQPLWESYRLVERAGSVSNSFQEALD